MAESLKLSAHEQAERKERKIGFDGQRYLLAYYCTKLGVPKQERRKLLHAETYADLERFVEGSGIRYGMFVVRYLKKEREADAFLALDPGRRASFVSMTDYADKFTRMDYGAASAHSAYLKEYSKALDGIPQVLRDALERMVFSNSTASGREPPVLDEMFMQGAASRKRSYAPASVICAFSASESGLKGIEAMRKLGVVHWADETGDYVSAFLKKEYGSQDPEKAYASLFGKEYRESFVRTLFMDSMGYQKSTIPVFGPLLNLISKDYKSPLMLLCAVRMARASKHMGAGDYGKAARELETMMAEMRRFTRFDLPRSGGGYTVGFSAGASTSLDAGASFRKAGASVGTLSGQVSLFPFPGYSAGAGVGPFGLSYGSHSWIGKSLSFGLDAFNYDILNSRFNIAGVFNISKDGFTAAAEWYFIGIIYGMQVLQAAGTLASMSGELANSPAGAGWLQGTSTMAQALMWPFLGFARTVVETADLVLPEMVQKKMGDAEGIHLIRYAEKLFYGGGRDQHTMALNYLDAVIDADGLSGAVKTVARERRALFRRSHWIFAGQKSDSASMAREAKRKCMMYMERLGKAKDALPEGKFLRIEDVFKPDEITDLLSNYYVLLSSAVITVKGGMMVRHDLELKNADDLFDLMSLLSQCGYVMLRMGVSEGDGAGNRKSLLGGEQQILFAEIYRTLGSFNPSMFKAGVLSMAQNGAMDLSDRSGILLMTPAELKRLGLPAKVADEGFPPGNQEFVELAMSLFLDDAPSTDASLRISGKSLLRYMGSKEVFDSFKDAVFAPLIAASGSGYAGRFFKSVWEGTVMLSPDSWAPLSYFFANASMTKYDAMRAAFQALMGRAGPDGNPMISPEFVEAFRAEMQGRVERMLKDGLSPVQALGKIQGEFESIFSGLIERGLITREAIDELTKTAEDIEAQNARYVKMLISSGISRKELRSRLMKEASRLDEVIKGMKESLDGSLSGVSGKFADACSVKGMPKGRDYDYGAMAGLVDAAGGTADPQALKEIGKEFEVRLISMRSRHRHSQMLGLTTKEEDGAFADFLSAAEEALEKIVAKEKSCEHLLLLEGMKAKSEEVVSMLERGENVPKGTVPHKNLEFRPRRD